MKIFLGSLAAAVLLSTTAALAVTESAPVKVTACQVYSLSSPGGAMVPRVTMTNGVLVTIYNASDKTVSGITVTGSYHGREVTDSAKLEIKPGESIEIARRYTPSVYVDADAQCHVTHAEFTDGSSWSP
jgi:hypothetical protein